MNTNKFLDSLHTHSEYSNLRLLDSTNKINTLLDFISNNDIDSIALTDHEALCGAFKYISGVNELKKQGKIKEDFRAILGNEIYLVDKDLMYEKLENKEKVTFYHFLLLAKNNKGFEQLRRLSTRAWERGYSYYGIDRVPTFYEDIEEIIGEDKGNLIGSTACLGGYLPKLILDLKKCKDEGISEEKQQKIKEQIDDFLNWCIDIFGKDNFYLEIQPNEEEEQKYVNDFIVNTLCKVYGLKYIITCDVHYLRPEDAKIHEDFLKSEDESSNREVASFYSSTYFHTIEEIYNKLSYLSKEQIVIGINNTQEIKKEIEDYSFFSEQIIPVSELPKEDTWLNGKSIEYINKYKDIYRKAEEYEDLQRVIINRSIYTRYIFNLVVQGLIDKTDLNKLDKYLDRLNTEFHHIMGVSKVRKQDISAYFLTMKDLINVIWEEAQSLVMCGRGSAGGYVINYLLGIVEVDAIEVKDKYDLDMPYYRFIHESKIELPDIDIDISSHKRDVVFQKILEYYQKQGGDAVRVGTFRTETSKSALNTACRGLGINNDVASYMTSLIPQERGKLWSIKDCYYGNKSKNREPVTELVNMMDNFEEQGIDLLTTVLKIEGIVSGRSSHASGVVLSLGDISDRCAVMKTPSGERITQFDLGDCENYCGLIKYDILITEASGCIQIAMELMLKDNAIEWKGSLRETYNYYFNPKKLIDNKEIWDLLCNHKLLNAFQYDGNTGEQAINTIKIESFIQAVAGNSVMRLMKQEGEQYTPLELYSRYKDNIELWYQEMKDYGLTEEEIEICKEIVGKDYGVMNTQENMMECVMNPKVANFTVPEANIARKGVAKKKDKLLKQAKELFFKKGQEIGASKTLLSYLWDIQIGKQRG